MNISLESVKNLNKGKIDKELINKIDYIINKNLKEKERYDLLDKIYKNDESILDKNRKTKEFADNKILCNFARYITELNVGYFMGEPINYNVNEGIDIEPVINKYRSNSMLDIDKSNAKKLSKYGECYELTYIDENSEIKTKSIDPRYAKVLCDNTLDEKEILGIYYSISNEFNYEEVNKIVTVYLYTDEKVCNFSYSLSEGINTSNAHLKKNTLKKIPLIHIKNNEEQIGDYETVISLIDAYNKVISNDIDNIEEFIDSIMIIAGEREFTKEQLKILKELRTLTVEKDVNISYLTKVLDETGISEVLSRLRKDIHKFSFTPDITDENFAGNSSGVALLYKLLPFELLTKTKQSHYEKAVKERFKLYVTFCNIIENMNIVDVSELDIKFKCGLPKNDLEVAGMITQLQGMVTNKTLISNLSFVQDANEEDELIKKEEKERSNQAQTEMMNTGNYNIGDKDGTAKETGKEKE